MMHGGLKSEEGKGDIIRDREGLEGESATHPPPTPLGDWGSLTSKSHSWQFTAYPVTTNVMQ